MYFDSVEKSCHSSVLQAAWEHDIDWRKPTIADLFENVCNHYHSEVQQKDRQFPIKSAMQQIDDLDIIWLHHIFILI